MKSTIKIRPQRPSSGVRYIIQRMTLFLVFAVILFAAAGTLNWIRGWVYFLYLLFIEVCTLIVLARRAPETLDLGYWHEGRLETEKHEKRSHDLILTDYKKYYLDNFPAFGDGYPRVAKAIGWVCYGHAREAEFPLSEIPHDYPDQAFEESTLDLRKLAALLRVADEADDPYIRQTGRYSQSKRSWTPLVEVEHEKVIWHWDRSEANDPAWFEELLAEKAAPQIIPGVPELNRSWGLEPCASPTGHSLGTLYGEGPCRDIRWQGERP